MHLKSVKYACKYALKTAKICTKTLKYALKNSKTSTTKVKTIKIRAYFLQKVKLF